MDRLPKCSSRLWFIFVLTKLIELSHPFVAYLNVCPEGAHKSSWRFGGIDDLGSIQTLKKKVIEPLETQLR